MDVSSPLSPTLQPDFYILKVLKEVGVCKQGVSQAWFSLNEKLSDMLKLTCYQTKSSPACGVPNLRSDPSPGHFTEVRD